MNNTVNIDETIQTINIQNKRIEELVYEIETNNDFAKSLQIELLEKDKEIERLKKYEKFVNNVIITPVDWNNENDNYQLHNMSKQDLYKELFELRHKLGHEMYEKIRKGE